jgi:hypothetical protein
MADAFGEDGVAGNQNGDPVADGKACSTGWAEEDIFRTLEGSEAVGIERTAEVGKKLVDHGFSNEGRGEFH